MTRKLTTTALAAALGLAMLSAPAHAGCGGWLERCENDTSISTGDWAIDFAATPPEAALPPVDSEHDNNKDGETTYGEIAENVIRDFQKENE